MIDVYTVPGVVETTHDPGTRTMSVVWKKLSGHEHLRPCMQAQVEQVRRGCKHLIVDVSEATGVLADEHQRWFETDIFPEYSRCGLEHLITVLPKSALTQLGAKRWNQTASSFGFKTFLAASREDARKLIEEAKSAA
jgi:hypothetical protein